MSGATSAILEPGKLPRPVWPSYAFGTAAAHRLLMCRQKKSIGYGEMHTIKVKHEVQKTIGDWSHKDPKRESLFLAQASHGDTFLMGFCPLKFLASAWSTWHGKQTLLT
eukprot:6077650-Amphidinium_carterae.1